ncbi:MAG: hypothetical protein JWO07_96 [Candidatus Saccharibacteria bacterium]|nr:hypothetical protein [Candidatus Saccharibacteria bacterium]
MKVTPRRLVKRKPFRVRTVVKPRPGSRRRASVQLFAGAVIGGGSLSLLLQHRRVILIFIFGFWHFRLYEWHRSSFQDWGDILMTYVTVVFEVKHDHVTYLTRTETVGASAVETFPHD